MPGPLPNPQRVRRNAPTIPTTNLPAGGRKGAAPKPPKWMQLDVAAKAWWAWAWSTPQAAAWSDGDLVTLARRARLEDVLGEDPANMAVSREARELDDRFGLTPKGMAALRWKIVADTVDEEDSHQAGGSGVASLDDRRRRLTGA